MTTVARHLPGIRRGIADSDPCTAHIEQRPAKTDLKGGLARHAEQADRRAAQAEYAWVAAAAMAGTRTPRG
jgi:hypothetical protein